VGVVQNRVVPLLRDIAHQFERTAGQSEVDVVVHRPLGGGPVQNLIDRNVPLFVGRIGRRDLGRRFKGRFFFGEDAVGIGFECAQLCRRQSCVEYVDPCHSHCTAKREPRVRACRLGGLEGRLGANHVVAIVGGGYVVAVRPGEGKHHRVIQFRQQEIVEEVLRILVVERTRTARTIP